MQNADKLVYWVQERDRIRQLKEAGAPKPWTSDWVFQQTYFCNVRREDDKVTRWIREHWSNPGNPNFEVAMVAARLLNWPPTLGIVGFPDGDIIQWIHDLDHLRDHEGKVWGNAYVVTTHGQRMDKITYLQSVLESCVDTKLRHRILLKAQELRLVADQLMQVNGIGSFLASQVVADLKNTYGHACQDAKDWHTFAGHGPGSLRGLTWLYGYKCTPKKFSSMMEGAHELIVEETGMAICRQDAQNCMCEFDKYMRVLTGTGRSKRGYQGA